MIKSMIRSITNSITNSIINNIINNISNNIMNSMINIINIRCPTSGVAQGVMKEAAPHARGVSKATLRRLAAVKTR
jgi:hypothetical protein